MSAKFRIYRVKKKNLVDGAPLGLRDIFEAKFGNYAMLTDAYIPWLEGVRDSGYREKDWVDACDKIIQILATEEDALEFRIEY